MSTITLSLSSKVDKHNGKAQLMIRFVGGRDLIFRVKSGIYINPNKLNEDNQKKGYLKISGNINTVERQELVKTEKEITDLLSLIKNSFNETEKSQVNKTWLENLITGFHHPESLLSEKEVKAKMTFFELYDEFLRTHKLSNARIIQFKVLRRMLQRFELYQSTISRETILLAPESLTEEFLRLFESYLYHEYKIIKKYPAIIEQVPESREPGERGANTVYDKFKKLKVFIHWLIDNDLISKNPFKNFKLKPDVYGTPYYLTISELSKLAAFDFTARPALAVQRDIFVFHCLTGARVADYFRFTKANIIGEYLEYIASKTVNESGRVIRVPLTERAKEILNKYPMTDNRLLPFISSQKYNDTIKELLKLAEINRVVTVLDPKTRTNVQRPIYEIASSHVARRTFSANLYLNEKDPAIVASMTGHSENSKAFSRYRVISDEIKTETIKTLDF